MYIYIYIYSNIALLGVTVSVSGDGCPGGSNYGNEWVQIQSPNYPDDYESKVSFSLSCKMAMNKCFKF